MSQFDIYANPNKNSRTAYPFIIDMQNNLVDDLATRIVAPLALYPSHLKMPVFSKTRNSHI